MTDKSKRRIVKTASVSFPEQKHNSKTRVLENALRWIDLASSDEPDMILFPELLSWQLERWVKEPETEKGDVLKEFSKKSRQYGIYLWCPVMLKEGKYIYNSAVLFNRSGAIDGIYRKHYPTIWELEAGVKPGEDLTVFDCDFGRVAGMICFDLNFRDIAMEYNKKKVELLCFLSMFRGGLQLEITAYEYNFFVASSTPFEGSAILNPIGEVLARSSEFGRIIVEDINLDSCVIHIDYNDEKIEKLKKAYGDKADIRAASPEAVYLISSLDRNKTVNDFIKEFGLERREDYFDRSRKRVKESLGG